MYLYIYIYICICNKYTQYTHILCKQKLSFWMRLITINHLTALVFFYLSGEQRERCRVAVKFANGVCE